MSDHKLPGWLAGIAAYVAVGGRRRTASEAHAAQPKRGRRRHPDGKRAGRRGGPQIEFAARDLPEQVKADLRAAVEHVERHTAQVTPRQPPGVRRTGAPICEAGCRSLDDCPAIAETEEPDETPVVDRPALDHPGARAQLAERAARLDEQRTQLAQCTDTGSNTLPSTLPAPISAPPVPPSYVPDPALPPGDADHTPREER